MKPQVTITRQPCQYRYIDRPGVRLVYERQAWSYFVRVDGKTRMATDSLKAATGAARDLAQAEGSDGFTLVWRQGKASGGPSSS